MRTLVHTLLHLLLSIQDGQLRTARSVFELAEYFEMVNITKCIEASFSQIQSHI